MYFGGVQGISHSLKLSPYRLLINYKKKRSPLCAGRQHFNQMIKLRITNNGTDWHIVLYNMINRGGDGFSNVVFWPQKSLTWTQTLISSMRPRGNKSKLRITLQNIWPGLHNCQCHEWQKHTKWPREWFWVKSNLKTNMTTKWNEWSLSGSSILKKHYWDNWGNLNKDFRLHNIKSIWNFLCGYIDGTSLCLGDKCGNFNTWRWSVLMSTA